jgi:hypothetical protein
VGQSSSQHDKCQVGDMHTYYWDLVHFGGFFPRFGGQFLSIIPSIRKAFDIEEAKEPGYQAHWILKRRVVRPMIIFTLGERFTGN